jgi:rubrerythrin
MSMLQAFERLLNKKRDQAEAREERVDREGQDEVEEGTLVCRACGYAGQEPYCPNCLSDTMRPARRAKKKAGERRHSP